MAIEDAAMMAPGSHGHGRHAQGDFGSAHVAMSAQLCSRYARPGGIVRGVVQLSTRHTASEPITEIAYVVAQIHAHVSVDSNLLSVPVVQLASPRAASHKERAQIENAHQNTHYWEHTTGALPDVRSFSGETGACLYLSAPHALLSDVNVAPTPAEANAPHGGRLETLRRCRRDFALALPDGLCPTFRGSAARVFYVLSITAQSAVSGCKPLSLHLPFEVYASSYSFSPSALLNDPNEAAITDPTAAGNEGEAPPSNDSLSAQRLRSVSRAVLPVGVRKGSELPFELRPSLMHGRVETERLQRAQTSIFTIGRDDSHLVRFLLTKQFYHPGEILLGMFDFSQASLPCVHVSATLSQEEVLASMALHPSKVVQSKVVASFQEYTSGVLQTSLRFCIPHDALPTITTDLVRFQWLLRFEFTAHAVDASTGAADATPQTFRWQVPIDVRPAIPREATSFANVPHKLFTGASRYVSLR